MSSEEKDLRNSVPQQSGPIVKTGLENLHEEHRDSGPRTAAPTPKPVDPELTKKYSSK